MQYLWYKAVDMGTKILGMMGRKSVLLAGLMFTCTAYSGDGLLERYRALLPYHKYILLPTVVEVCEENIRRGGGAVCRQEPRERENLETFEELLEETEWRYEVQDTDFLDSVLGRHYRNLSDFIIVYKSFSECRKEASWGMADFLGRGLLRLSANIPDPESTELLAFGVTEGRSPGESVLLDALVTGLRAGGVEVGSICESANFSCTSEERELVGYWLQESGKELPVVDVREAVERLNKRIARMNVLLAEYSKKKGEWEKGLRGREKAMVGVRWRREHRLRSQLKLQGEERMRRLKEEIFSTWRGASEELGGYGRLLQTDVLREATGLGRLEKMVPQWWGILGFKKEVLENTEDFPVLVAVNEGKVAEAVSESSERMREQVRTILRELRKGEYAPEEEGRLLMTYPVSAGRLLGAEPEYGEWACRALSELSKRERNRDVWELAAYLGLGVGIAAASVATMGGVLPGMAIIGATAGGAAFTVGDYIYQKSQAEAGRRVREKQLNSYLAGTGDKGSVGEIRREREKVVESERNARIALGFGVFDLAGIAPAARVGAFVRLGRKLEGIDVRTKRHRKLLNRIAKNDRFIRAVRNFKENYPEELMGRWLDEVSQLSQEGQKRLLERLAESGGNPGELGVDALKSMAGEESFRRLESLSLEVREFDKRRKWAEEVLGKRLGLAEAEGVLRAHRVGDGERGSYTMAQKLRKNRILKESGFGKGEIRSLMSMGVVGREVILVEEFLLPLLESKKEFPRLFSESIKHDVSKILHEQGKLVEKLRARGDWEEWEKMRPEKLLTIDIVIDKVGKNRVEQIIDPKALSRFGEKLVGMLPVGAESMSKEELSGYFLGKIRNMLSVPRIATVPETLLKGLLKTVESREIKEKILHEFKRGNYESLERNLPEYPDKWGFRHDMDKKRIGGLEPGRKKDYYVNALKESHRSSKRLDGFAALYIFSKIVPSGGSLKRYLREMDEAKLDVFVDPLLRIGFVKDFVKENRVEDGRILKTLLHRRLRSMAEKVLARKVNLKRELTASDGELSLVEVPPALGIFKGNVAGDCATRTAFGYVNSPLERTFVVMNRRGEDVGYLAGTHVRLPEGEKGFFINTISGAKISGAMTDTIFSGMEKAKGELGVEKLVMLGSSQESHNINYTIIQNAYKKHRGGSVRISFPDKKIREAIRMRKEFESEAHLADANHVVGTDEDITVFVKERARAKGKNSTVAEFLENNEDVSEEELGLIFNIALDSKVFPVELFDKILGKGFDINAINKHGSTAFHSYVRGTGATLEGIKYFVKRGADTSRKDDLKQTPFHVYLKNRRVTVEGIKYFVKKGAKVNEADGFKRTPLHFYTNNPNVTLEGIEYFIDSRANAKAKDNFRQTPLHDYVSNQNVSLEGIKYLVEKGANVDVENYRGNTPFEYYLSSSNVTLEGIKYFIKKGASVHREDNLKRTPLHHYTSNNPTVTLEGIKYFVEKGADIYAKSKMKRTPFHHYIENPNITIEGIKYFIKKMPSINAVDYWNNSLLHYYVLNPNVMIKGIKCFIEEGANLYIKNGARETPLDYYLKKSPVIEPEIISLLTP